MISELVSGTYDGGVLADIAPEPETSQVGLTLGLLAFLCLLFVAVIVVVVVVVVRKRRQ
jgi:hypothetical protein